MPNYMMFLNGASTAAITDTRTTGLPPTGISAQYLIWPATTAAELEVTITVTTLGNEPNRVYFLAVPDIIDNNGTSLAQPPFGLHWNQLFPTGHAIYWGGTLKSTGGTLTGTASTLPTAIGSDSHRNYTWQTGRAYKYRIWSPNPGSWRGEITDTVTSATTIVRDLSIPGSTQLRGLIIATQNYNTCQTGIAARWNDVTFKQANGSTSKPATATVNYTSFADGGCTNTNATENSSGILVTLGTTRTTPEGTTLNVPGGGTNPTATGEFTVNNNGRMLDPTGTPYWGAGMNVAVSINMNGGNPSPYVFEGLPGTGTYDIWAPNPIPGTLLPGGGVTAGNVWSPENGGIYNLPDRAYALNGTLSAAAQSKGITAPPDHWHQKIMRVTCQPRGDGDNPSPPNSIPQYVAKVQQLIDLGFVVMPEIHNQTGANLALPTAFINNPTIATASMGGDQRTRDAVDFMDAMVAAFGTNGTGGTTPKQKGYVWFDLPNEAWNSVRDANYDDWVVTQVRRIRATGAKNIISIPLPVYCQGLGQIAAGAMDGLRTKLISHGVDYNLAWAWHAYGADWGATNPGGQGYVGATGYAQMETHILAARNGSPGGHKWCIVMGEYGETIPLGASNAGPDAWTRGAIDCLFTNTHGTPLAEKYSLFPIAWHASGDGVFFKLFKLTYGTPIGDNNETSGQGYPVWRIDGTNTNRLTRFGTVHWNTSHNIWTKNT